MSGRDSDYLEARCPRLGRRLGTDGDDRQARTGRGERPRSRAGHEQRNVGVGHVGAQLDRPVQRQEVRLQNVPPRTLRGREQERSTRQLVTQAFLRVGRRDEVDVQPVMTRAPRP